MCFHGKRNEDAKLATRNIKVVKLLKKNSEGKLESPYQGGRWREGMIKSAPMKTNTGRSGTVGRGLHAFIDRDKALAVVRNTYWNMIAYEAIIPAGAYYFKNKTHYVSSQMVVLGPLNKRRK